jgi:hypothetical protein
MGDATNDQLTDAEDEKQSFNQPLSFGQWAGNASEVDTCGGTNSWCGIILRARVRRVDLILTCALSLGLQSFGGEIVCAASEKPTATRSDCNPNL